MADQAWPQSPAEQQRTEEKKAAIQKLSVDYQQMCRRQRREYIGFVIVEVALTALCFATGVVKNMESAGLFAASLVGGLAGGLAYFAYAAWREAGIRRVRREIEKMRTAG